LSVLRVGAWIVVHHLLLRGLRQAWAHAIVAVLILLRSLQGLGALVLVDETLQLMLILQGLEALLYIALIHILI